MPVRFPLDVRWTQSDKVREARITNAEQGVALFREISAASRDDPTMVEFADDHVGLAFAIGAGRTVTVLTAQWSLDPPYFTSKAPTSSEAMDADFLYAGENTPYPGSSVIPFDDGLAALAYFLKTGELDPKVAWERL